MMQFVVLLALATAPVGARSVRSASGHSLQSETVEAAPALTIAAVAQLASSAKSAYDALGISPKDTQPNVRFLIRNKSNRDWYLGQQTHLLDGECKILSAAEKLEKDGGAFYPLEARFSGCLPYFSISPTTHKKEYILFCFQHPWWYTGNNRIRACYIQNPETDQQPNANTFDQCFKSMDAAEAAYIGADKYDPLHVEPGGWRWEENGQEHIMSRDVIKDKISVGHRIMLGETGDIPAGIFVEYRVVDLHTTARGDYIIWENYQAKVDYWNKKERLDRMQEGQVSYDEKHHKSFFEKVEIQNIDQYGLIKKANAPMNSDNEPI